MSRVMQHFRECLDEKHVEWCEYRLDADVVTDKNVNIFPPVDPAWDVHGWSNQDKVTIYLRSGISPEFAAQIIEIYENYFHEKKEKQYE